MSEKKKNFINMMAPHVREIAARTGLDPRLILAQSAVETGWGGKAPGHNYFGIKSHNREGGQNFMTTEFIRGVPVKKIQNFREYSGPQESSQDYANFILENPRYQEAMKAKTIDDQIKAIGKSGYATDPRYGQKLRAVALGIELPPEPQQEDRPITEEQRPVEQKQQAQPIEQPQFSEQEAEAVSYNQIDSRDEPVAFADGGAVDDEDEGLTAYHGSPHDFEQFDTGKIGTGEGAQAYGHGLYFAENENIARNYRDALSQTRNPTSSINDLISQMSKNSPQSRTDENVQWYMRQDPMLKEHANDDEIVRHILTALNGQNTNGTVSEDAIDAYGKLTNKFGRDYKGHMYEVRINAHPDHFVDFDAALSEQSEYIKDALRKRYGDVGFQKLINRNEDGEYIARRIENQEHLNEMNRLGIKGIRYLDAGSRKDTDQPTRNYVVFNHDHVQVKQKYAQGGAIAGA